MMDRYTLLGKIGIYIAIFFFLLLMLLPFFEMFMASLRPLEHLFRSPYQFWSEDFSFDAYRNMWVTMPLLGRYIANSFFIAASVTVITMVFVIPAAYAYAQQFLFAITFNQERTYQPLPAGLFEFTGYQSVTWNEMMAAALVGILPVMVIFLFLQKFLVAGLTAGAVKE